MTQLILVSSMYKTAVRLLNLFILLIATSSLFSQQLKPYSFIVNTDEGFIDYANRIIVCRGTSDIEERMPVDNSLDLVEKNIKIAKAEARTQARSNLIELMKKVKSASESTGEKVWEFPLWPEFCKQIQSEIADVKNTGAPMQAGTIAGGAFLKEFVDSKIPWVHFDIAGTAWGVKPDSVNPKGSATGVGVRLVLDMFGV